MPRKKKTPTKVETSKPPRDVTNWTKPSQFRLTGDTLAELDLIAAHLSREMGITHSRTDAIRYAARQTAKSLGLISSK